MKIEESISLLEKFYLALTGRRCAPNAVFPSGRTGYFPYERFTYLRALCEVAMEDKYKIDRHGNHHKWL